MLATQTVDQGLGLGDVRVAAAVGHGSIRRARLRVGNIGDAAALPT